ncbi:MAG: PBP1A family penicillin-binding protein [Candidatus Nealsonbacteria bacterium]|nr:PBP1A family penicillin-binding protein [Candidatus Nealsonbacteria bacterium]
MVPFLVFIFYAKDLPRPESFTEKQSIQSTKIFDRTGKILLYEIYGEEKRTLVPLSSIPEYLKQAVIATEDSNFYNNIGIDPKGILRSILINLNIKESVYSGSAVGGSTIPQQLIRSTFLTNEKTIQRKIREIVLSLELNRRYPKDQILEWYLNQIPFGSNSYGVETASQTYFGKPVSEISLPQAAVLAALIQAPSRLSPFGGHKDELLARKDYVLNRLASEGFITQEKAEEAQKEEIKFIEKPMQIKAPYFSLWVKQQITDRYGEEALMKDGLKVYTSLDWGIQQLTEKATKDGVERNKSYNAYNAGAVVIDPKTGEVLAMTVGTGDYYAEPYPKNCTAGVDCLFDPRFNVVVGTKSSPGRQPGSAFKPFIYVTAFKNGYDDKTIINDELTSFGIWGGEEYVPQNYDGLFRGPVTIRQALSQSLNVPAVKTLMNLAGLQESIKTAQSMGITTLNPPYGPAIVLGGWEVKLLDMASAYGVFATEGLKVPPVSILKIEDQEGNIVEENKKTPERVLGKEECRLINDILSDNVARTPMFGATSHLYFENYQVAAKTGTTDSFRDCWTIGYAPSVVVGIWVGNNNNEPMIRRQPAATVAGPIFHEIMEKILSKSPEEYFTRPEGAAPIIIPDNNATQTAPQI